MDWIYRFTANDRYPDPLEEIDALCTLDFNEEPAFLLLGERNSPPMSKASPGQIVGLCTSQDNRLILHGTAIVGGPPFPGNTPSSVQPIYGNLDGRFFCPLRSLEKQEASPLPETELSLDEQQNFLSGMAYVKRINTRHAQGNNSVSAQSHGIISPYEFPQFSLFKFPHNPSGFVVVGLDPTAGTWPSRMTEGPKMMPSFALRWHGDRFSPDENPLVLHRTNRDFWNNVERRDSNVVCIDGPCATNGPRILTASDPWHWDPNAPNGTRACEVALSRKGVNLFWTTQNTVMHFEGASRWIARSLTLFSETQQRSKI
jgi:hypothetical protein